MIVIINFTFTFTNFCVIVFLLTKLLTFRILFSTAVNAELVAKPLLLGILPSTSLILELKSVFFNQVTNVRNFFVYLTDFFFKI